MTRATPHNRGFVWLPILLVVIALAVIGGGAYYVTHISSTSQTASNTEGTTVPPTQTTATSAVLTTAVPSNWVTYEGDSWSISYPPGWKLTQLPAQLHAISLSATDVPSSTYAHVGIDFGPMNGHSVAASFNQMLSGNPGLTPLEAYLAVWKNTHSDIIESAGVVSVGSLQAMQGITESQASDRTYANQASFISKDNYLVDFTLATQYPLTPSLLDEYYAILSSFKFK